MTHRKTPGEMLLSRKLQVISFLIIAVITALVYYPSLFHAARLDHLAYLGDTAKLGDGFKSLALDTYAFNRTREFLPRDQILFRPVLYFLLGTERWLFGYNFFWWQLTSLALHLCVAWTLLKVLMNEGAHPLAPVFTLFFSVQYASADMVMWQHLSGYLLFAIFLLSAIYHLRTYERGGAQRSGFLLVLFLLLAAFTYELGNAAAVFMALFMIMKRKGGSFSWKTIAAALMIPALYISISALDLYSRFGSLSALGQVSGAAHAGIAGKTALLFFIWLLSGALPSLINLVPYERVYLASFNTTLTPLVATGLVAASVLAASCIFIWRKAQARKNAGLIALMLALMLAQAAIFVIGRADPKGFWHVVAGNSYYVYVFYLMAIVALYASLGLKEERPPAFPVAGLGLSLLVISAISAVSVHDLGKRLAEYSGPRTEFVQRIDGLVSEHSGEAGFTFSVSDSCKGLDFTPEDWELAQSHADLKRFRERQGNDVLRWLDKKGDPPGTEHTLAEVLFPRYYVESGAKYEVTCPAP